MSFRDAPPETAQGTLFSEAEFSLIQGTLGENLDKHVPGWPWPKCRGSFLRLWESARIEDIARLAHIGAAFVDIGAHQYNHQHESGLRILADKFRRIVLEKDDAAFDELHMELTVARALLKGFPERLILEPYDRPYRQGPPEPSPDFEVKMSNRSVAVETTAVHWEPLMRYKRQESEMCRYFFCKLPPRGFIGELHIDMNLGPTQAQTLRRDAIVREMLREGTGDIEEGGCRLRWHHTAPSFADGMLVTQGRSWTSTWRGVAVEGLVAIATSPRFQLPFEDFERWFREVKVKGKRRQLRGEIPTILVLSDPSVVLSRPGSERPEELFEYLANRTIFEDQRFAWLSALAIHIPQSSFVREASPGSLIFYWNQNARHPVSELARARFASHRLDDS